MKYLPEIPSGNRVDPVSRLIEEKHGRLVYQRACQSEFLFHAAGQVLCFSVLERGKVAESKKLIFRGISVFTGDLIKVPVKTQILKDCQVSVKAELLRHITDLFFHCFRIRCHRVSVHEDISLGGQKDSRCHSHNGSFSCSVRPDQAKDLSFVYGEIHPPNSPELTELSAEVLYFYGLIRILMTIHRLGL